MSVAQAVDGDPSDPAHGVVVLADGAPLLVGLHEGLLHGIGCGFLAAGHHREGAHQPPVVGSEERLEVRAHGVSDPIVGFTDQDTLQYGAWFGRAAFSRWAVGPAWVVNIHSETVAHETLARRGGTSTQRVGIHQCCGSVSLL